MGQITPSFLFDLESNMRMVTSAEYERLARSLWWDKIAKTMQSSAKRERIAWLLDTAQIERTSRGGGQVAFEDLVMVSTEYENENAAAGLELKKEQLEDLDGNGVKLAASWSRQIGAHAAYWPQRCVADAIKANPTGYDGAAYFSSSHPVNPHAPAAGTYSNDLTGGASGIYPGAVPIGGATTVDVALDNLAKVAAYVASIKMPNGTTPRGLRIRHLFVPPALYARATQLTSARVIAQAAATGGGGADVEGVIRAIGLGEPVLCPELGSAFSGSDSTYYVGCESILSDELGAFVYVNREPFSVGYHGPMTDAELARKRAFQWTTEGRNTVGPGHPYLLIRCKAT